MTYEKIEAALEALKTAMADDLKAAYEHGKRDAKAEILAILSTGGAVSVEVAQNAGKHGEVVLATISEAPDFTPANHERKRAPRGLPRTLTERALREYLDVGRTPADILDYATTSYEKMIKLSSLRSELRKGEKEGRYREHSGVWFLTEINNEIGVFD